jgi:hypothetical protein
MNKWDEMREAYSEAKNTIRAADEVVDGMAGIVLDKLRGGSISTYKLARMKHILRDFNEQTKRWMR